MRGGSVASPCSRKEQPLDRIAIIVMLSVVGLALMTSLMAVVIAVTRGRRDGSEGPRRPPPPPNGTGPEA